MKTMYFLVNVETVLAFDFQITEECEGVQSLYSFDIAGKSYWLIATTNKKQLLKTLFNKPKKYIKLAKKCAIGLIKPEYYEISENLAKAIIKDEFN